MLASKNGEASIENTMVTSPSQAKHIGLAEDNLADVLLVRMALKSSGLTYDLRVLDDGEKAVPS